MSIPINFTQGKVVIYFTASWCGPCQTIKPFWEQMVQKYANLGLTFHKIDVDDSTFDSFRSMFEYKGIPAFFFLKDSAQVEGWTGANANRLEKSIQNLINS